MRKVMYINPQLAYLLIQLHASTYEPSCMSMYIYYDDTRDGALGEPLCFCSGSARTFQGLLDSQGATGL